MLSATVRVAGDLDVAEECAQEAYDGRWLQFHDMDLLTIDLEPEDRMLTFWFRWDPATFAATPVARLRLHRARIAEWDEEPIEPLPPGVSREVRNMSFEAPNFLEFESLNLRLLIELQHVALAVLADEGRWRSWSDLQ